MQHAIDTATSTTCYPIVLVTGANEYEILPLLKTAGVHILYNQGWQEGMASTLRMGISYLQKDPSILQTIVMLCDQPFVDTSLLQTLITTKNETKKKIITSFFDGTYGPPALFDKSLFDELMEVRGDEGAKKLLTRYPDQVQAIPFLQGGFDIDTMEDYKKLLTPGETYLTKHN